MSHDQHHVAVLGAGCRVGSSDTVVLLGDGHDVTATVRDPDRHPGLPAVRGDEGDIRELSHLVDIVHGVAASIQRHTDHEINTADRTRVRGQRQALDRAVGSLLENAAEFDRFGAAPIEVGNRIKVSTS
ncbi:hypothetical protein [Lentzea fradiae]|uniref:hypothetical protein n=1 Tax=Lentzea fradiae TaxID=200378 RepID=UPI00115F7D75|nr:hypothetical protein [Lentzea fradiae]